MNEFKHAAHAEIDYLVGALRCWDRSLQNADDLAVIADMVDGLEAQLRYSASQVRSAVPPQVLSA